MPGWPVTLDVLDNYGRKPAAYLPALQASGVKNPVVQIVDEANGEIVASWDRSALTTHGFGNHAVRTEQWRYIRYRDGGEELYDETTDPFEWTNLESDAKYQKIKAALAERFPKVDAPRRRPADKEQ